MLVNHNELTLITYAPLPKASRVKDPPTTIKLENSKQSMIIVAS